MIFLIGGAGLIGSSVAAALMRADIPFEVITRDNWDHFKGRSCSTVINCNGNSKKFLANSNPLLDFRLSVQSVYESLVEIKYDNYIYLSSGDVYQTTVGPNSLESNLCPITDPFSKSGQSIYAQHKFLAEQLVTRNSKNWIIFRGGGFVGPGLKKNVIFDLLTGNKVWLHKASALSFLDTATAGAVVVDMMQANISSEVFNLSGRSSLTVSELIEITGADDDLAIAPPDVEPVNHVLDVTKLNEIFRLPTTEQVVRNFVSLGQL